MKLVNIASALMFVTAVSVPALAQQPNRPVTGGDEKTMLVAGGLTFLSFGETAIGFAGNVLFNAPKTISVGKIGVVADFGLNTEDGDTITTFAGGGRLTFDTQSKFIPYGQFLLALSHCCGDSHFGPAIGFGTDIAWKPDLNFRAEVQIFFLEFKDATRWFFGVSKAFNK